MAIISTIGRRSLKVRVLIGSIYTVLTIGAVTMIYPFLLMIAGSTKSQIDVSEHQVIPSYMRDDTMLWRKHAEGFFNEKQDMVRMVYQTSDINFTTLPLPDETKVNGDLAAEWQTFCTQANLSPWYYGVSYVNSPRTKVYAKNLRNFKKQLIDRFEGQIHELNAAFSTDYTSWNDFYLLPAIFVLRRSNPRDDAFNLAYQNFKASRPFEDRYYLSICGYYVNNFLAGRYSNQISKYNEACGTHYSSFDELYLPESLADAKDFTPQEKEEWALFVRQIVNVLWLRADSSAAPIYHAFLKAKYTDIKNLNERYGTLYETFDEIPIVEDVNATSIIGVDWMDVLTGWKDPTSGETYCIPLDAIRIHSVDFMFQDYLAEKYQSVEKMNTALHTTYANFDEILPPQLDTHYLNFLKTKDSIRSEFTWRNFITVFDYILLHGRGVFNTIVYCLLAIMSALIINPLAAYALSRYKPPSQYKILLFLMLTMAFPPMVTQIPVFLMLREFNLLNTFWALILPGLANGYAIFLLKGFFDSLPQELYESASLDGAGEFRIFWQITMSLSTPILAVIALNAFTHAYANFMMALLICQDEKMWTIMPWLYQLQQRSGEGVVFASLLVASVPTFLIFAFCQNIIMRGIVVPVEK